MPIGEYYKGHGTKVMKDMKDRYGEAKGERVFYATANKHKAMRAPESNVKKSMKSIMKGGRGKK